MKPATHRTALTPRHGLKRRLVRASAGFLVALGLSVLFVVGSIEYAVTPRGQTAFSTTLISLALLVTVALLIGTWAAERAALRITKPLLDLTRAAQTFASGDHTVHVKISSGDELEVLANTFNSMVNDLSITYSQLEKQNIELTQKCQVQQEQTETQDHLVRSQKMDAFGQLAGKVAHDFNNILATVIGNSELVETMTFEPDNHAEMRRLIKEISDAADRGTDLTRQLLTFAKRESDAPRMVDVNDSLIHFESLFRPELGETIDLRIELGQNLRKVYIDPSRLDQVMMNLCVNARDAMPAGGTLLLRTLDVGLLQSSQLTSGPILPGRYTALEVHDTGTGMSVEMIARAFEPFFTTKPAKKGAGLGLSTVHGIVRSAGGILQIDSAPGAGATFRVYLPVHEELDPAINDDGRTEPPVGRGERILVCEDNDAVRMMTARILEKGGYQVVTAAQASSAIQLIPDGDFQLLITDVVMPAMDGGELVETVKALNKEMPVLFVSGYTAGVLVSYGIQDDSPNFLRKPFRANTLLERVHALMSTDKA